MAKSACGATSSRRRCSGGFVHAAELDRTQLWMIERVPIDERVLMMDVAPTQDRQRLVRRRTEIPEVVRLLASGHLVDDVPELGRPPEDTEVLVRPVVGGAAHRVSGIPREVGEDGMHRIAGQRGADSAEL